MSENSENGENSEIFYCLEPSCKQNRLITDYKEIIQHVVEKHNIVEYDKFQELLSQKFSEQNIKKMLGNEVIKQIQDIILEKIQNLCDQINRLKAYFFNVFPNEFDKYILPTSSIIQTAQKFKNLVFSNEYKDNILFFEKEMTQFMEAYQNDFLTQNKYQLLFEKMQLDVKAFQFEFEFDVQPIIETFQNWINNYDSNQNKLIKSEPKIIDLFNNNQIQSQPKMVDNHHSLFNNNQIQSQPNMVDNHHSLFNNNQMQSQPKMVDNHHSLFNNNQIQSQPNMVDNHHSLFNNNQIQSQPNMVENHHSLFNNNQKQSQPKMVDNHHSLFNNNQIQSQPNMVDNHHSLFNNNQIQSQPNMVENHHSLFNNNQMQSQPKMVDNHHSLFNNNQIQTQPNMVDNHHSLFNNNQIQSQPNMVDNHHSLFGNNQIQSQPKIIDNHQSLIQQQKVSYRRQYKFQILGKDRHVEISHNNCSVSSSKSAQVMINLDPNNIYGFQLKINKIEPYPGQKNKIKIIFYGEDEEEILTVYNKKLLFGLISIIIGHSYVSVYNNDNNFDKTFYNDYSYEIQEIVIFFTGYEIDLIQ